MASNALEVTAQVDARTKQTWERMTALFRSSAQEAINGMQRAVRFALDKIGRTEELAA